MDLNKFIPKNDFQNWKISKKRAFRMKLCWIPIFEEKNNTIFVFFDLREFKTIIRIIDNLQKENINFFLINPEISNPKNKKMSEINKNKINIENYLRLYSDVKFYDGFEKINFNLVDNLVRYCREYNCYELLKSTIDIVNEEISRKEYDYYGQREFYPIREDIRHTFSSMYRDIQISKVFN